MFSRHKVAIAVGIVCVVGLMLATFTFPMMASSRRGSLEPKPSTEVSGNPPTPPVALYGKNGAKNFAELFHNIKTMTIEFNFSSTDSYSSSSERISYSVGMASMDDGSIAYRVNLTDFDTDGNESALVWIAPSTGAILQVSTDGQYWTGANAQKESGVLSFISTDYWLSLLNSSTFTQIVGNHPVHLGSTLLDSTTYESLSTLGSFQNMVLQVGTIASCGMQIVLYASYVIPGGGSATFRVISLG